MSGAFAQLYNNEKTSVSTIKSYSKQLSKAAILEDNKITLEEAMIWWRDGEGDPLYADLSLIDLSGVTKEHFASQNQIYINLFSISEDGYVYGTIGLELLKNGNVVAFKGYDTYDFDIKSPFFSRKHFVRNIFTAIGMVPHGKGNAFNIIFYGEGTIGK